MIGRPFTVACVMIAATAAHADTSAPTAAALRSFVDRWVDAQNKGDFAAYAKLYAPEFHGVRRSGKRSLTLDRKGWLIDRKRMFKKPMTVSVSDVRIDGLAVKLVQTFVQGTYKDVGPKALALEWSGGELLIAHEEMLASNKSVNPGPLTSVLVTRDSGDGETEYAYLTPETCRSAGAPGGDVIVRAALATPPPGAKVELALFDCDLERSSPRDGEPEYMVCSCDDEQRTDAGSVTLPARATVHHRFPSAMPCGVVARARVRLGGRVIGELSAGASAGSCPE
jgi:hypothetical protein